MAVPLGADTRRAWGPPTRRAGAARQVVAMTVHAPRAVPLRARVARRLVVTKPSGGTRRVATRALSPAGVPTADGAPVDQTTTAQVVVLAGPPAGVAQVAPHRAMLPPKPGMGGPRTMGAPPPLQVAGPVPRTPKAAAGEAAEGVLDGPAGPEAAGRPGARDVVADGVARQVARLGLPRTTTPRVAP